MGEKAVQFIADHWGDIVSALGLLVAVVGFAITIRTAAKAKRAAEDARDRISMIDTVSQYSQAMSIMEEIKRLHREEAWAILPDRYGMLRGLLVTIRSSDIHLSENQRQILDEAIQYAGEIEYRIERSNHTGLRHPSVTNMNKGMSEQLDRITALFAEIRVRTGE